MVISRMIQDEGRPIKFSPDWPPKPMEKQLPNVFTKCTNDQFKKVSWPPRSSGVPNDSAGNPSQTLQLRGELPLNDEAAKPTATYKAAPPIYADQPENLSGDVWPPPEPINERVAFDAARPKRATRDYTMFFNKNAAAPTQPVYRVPPGTLHVISQRGVLSYDSPDLGGARMAQQ